MKPFTKIAVLVLVVVGIVHLLRLIGSWPVSVNGATVPMWASAVALIVSWGLAALVWREHRAR